MPETVRERPILFSGPMVRAILGGRKTQTRRVIKPQPEACDHADWPEYPNPQWRCDSAGWLCEVCGNGVRITRDDVAHIRCPFGQPGDRLWVRETWDGKRSEAVMMFDFTGRVGSGETFTMQQTAYRATYEGKDAPVTGNWKPSIHMPRWASRLLLEVTDVRVERLQMIREEDARAEGVTDGEWGFTVAGLTHSDRGPLDDGYDTARDCFADLWDSINAKRGYGWDVNPWVWVVSFRRIDKEVNHA